MNFKAGNTFIFILHAFGLTIILFEGYFDCKQVKTETFTLILHFNLKFIYFMKFFLVLICLDESSEIILNENSPILFKYGNYEDDDMCQCFVSRKLSFVYSQCWLSTEIDKYFSKKLIISGKKLNKNLKFKWIRRKRKQDQKHRLLSRARNLN